MPSVVDILIKFIFSMKTFFPLVIVRLYITLIKV